MTNFLLITLALTQIPVVFIFTTRYICRVNEHMGMGKNPDWVAAHPEFTAPRICNMAMQGFSYLLAAATLLALIKFTVITPTPAFYIALLVGPTGIWTLAFMIYTGFFHYGIVKKIPAPDVVKASLVDRRLSAYVPIWMVYLCYGILAAIIIFYGWALISGTLAAELAIRRLVGLSVVIVIGTVILLIILRRKSSELELIVGSSGRKIEVIFSIAVLYLGVVVGIYRILGDYFNIFLFTDAGFFIVINVFIQGAFLAYGLNPKVRSMLREYARK